MALVAEVAISPLFAADDFAGTPLSEARVEELDSSLGGFIGDQIVRIKIWDASGLVLYSDDDETLGREFEILHELEEAVAGEISSELSDLEGSENVSESEFTRLLEVYVPLRTAGSDEITGAFELYLPYGPEEGVARDSRRVMLILAVALGLLYLALARVGVDWARAHERADTKTIEADHDGLTGLANRRMVERELDALANTKDPKDFALLYLDLDQFKTVNDRFGHAAGDEILKAVARRLQGAVRSDAIVARVGGDEFAFIVPDLEHESEVGIVAERVMLAFDQPFRLGDSQIDVRASIGVDVTTETNRNPDDLRRNADRAMYEMKHARQADASGQSG